MMDDRTRRLGQHTAETTPAWAVTALGLVPADPAARRDWEHKAAAIAAYCETYGYDHPGDPIGPEPGHQTPGQRAAWYEAFAALSPAGQLDVRACRTGACGYSATPTPPRPPGHPATSAGNYGSPRLGAIRADAEADAACKTGDYDRAARHEHLAASYRALRDHYQQREQTFALIMADRQEWELATARSRRLAITADAELRRRHPRQKIEPLRSAEPLPVSDAERQRSDLIPHQRGGERARSPDLKEQRHVFRAAMNEHQRRVPIEDAARGAPTRHFPPFRALAGCDPAAAQAADNPIGRDPPARPRSRHRTRGRRPTMAHRSTVKPRVHRTPTVSLGICTVRACYAA